MFTVKDIDEAHKKVLSGADFPKYIQDIKQMGVTSFETWVFDSHTQYYGPDSYTTTSEPKYETLTINDTTNKEMFIAHLKAHQKGETDYYTFCTDCAHTGVEKWVVDLDLMTCTYFDKKAEEVLVETIPS